MNNIILQNTLVSKLKIILILYLRDLFRLT